MIDFGPPPKLWTPAKPAIIRASDILRPAEPRFVVPAGVGFFVAPSRPLVITGTQLFSATLDSDANESGYSVRTIIDPSGTASWTQIRVQFEAAAASTTVVDNASVGIQSSTYVTTATPTELKFSGASGFSLSAGQTIWSDWLSFSFAGTNNLIVVTDMAGTNGNIRYVVSGGSGAYEKASTDSYNVASPTGFSLIGASATVCVKTVEAA